jgi:hypothetical protein
MSQVNDDAEIPVPTKPFIELGPIASDGEGPIFPDGDASPDDNDMLKFKLTPAGFYINVITLLPEFRNVAVNALKALRAETEEPFTHKLRRIANILNTAADEIEEIEAGHPKPEAR